VRNARIREQHVSVHPRRAAAYLNHVFSRGCGYEGDQILGSIAEMSIDIDSLCHSRNKGSGSSSRSGRSTELALRPRISCQENEKEQRTRVRCSLAHTLPGTLPT